MIHKSLTMLVLMIGVAKKGTKTPCRPPGMRVEGVTSSEDFHALIAASNAVTRKLVGVDGSNSSMDLRHGQEAQATFGTEHIRR
jgi:hypothetical protein